MLQAASTIAHINVVILTKFIGYCAHMREGMSLVWIVSPLTVDEGPLIRCNARHFCPIPLFAPIEILLNTLKAKVGVYITDTESMTLPISELASKRSQNTLRYSESFPQSSVENSFRIKCYVKVYLR